MNPDIFLFSVKEITPVGVYVYVIGAGDPPQFQISDYGPQFEEIPRKDLSWRSNR